MDGVRYYWWNCDELLIGESLLNMIVDEGAANLVLRFYPRHPDYDHRPMFELVDRQTGEVCGTYNVSHTCPPDCE